MFCRFQLRPCAGFQALPLRFQIDLAVNLEIDRNRGQGRDQTAAAIQPLSIMASASHRKSGRHCQRGAYV